MESDHKHLTEQRSFYVTLSRARENAYLISDNKEKFIATLGQNTGIKAAALEHQNVKLK